GRARLLRQQPKPAVDRREDRLDVQVLVRGDDRGGNFFSLQQLLEVPGDEVRPSLLLEQREALLLEVRHADEVHHRMARGDLAAEKPYPPGPDNGEADA